MKPVALAALFASALAVAACTTPNTGRLTPTGTGTTPSGGIVPAQTPQ